MGVVCWTAAGSLLAVSVANQVFGLSEAETLFTGATAAEGNLRIAFSLDPSCLTCPTCFGQHELVLQQDRQLFDIMIFIVLLGYSNREQWSLTPTGRYNEKTARYKVPDTSWTRKPTCIDDTGTFVTAGLNSDISNVTSWFGDSTSQCGELSHSIPPAEVNFPIFWTQSKWTFYILTSKLKQK